MNLEITTRSYDPTKRVRTTIEDRSDKFTKFLPGLQQVRFTLSEEKIEFHCDIHLHWRGKEFHAKARTDDMLTSVEKACSSMDQQLRRHKTKRNNHRVRDAEPGTTSASQLESSIVTDRPGEE